MLYPAAFGTLWGQVLQGTLWGHARPDPINLGGGRIRVFDDAAAGYAHLAWKQVGWTAYNEANGETWPAVGNIK